jgi:hypothetical protein
MQWAAVEEHQVPKDKHWASEVIDGSHGAVRDGGGLEHVTITRDADGSWTIASKDWNQGKGGSVKFDDKTTASFTQLVILGGDNFDEPVFNKIILDVTK